MRPFLRSCIPFLLFKVATLCRRNTRYLLICFSQRFSNLRRFDSLNNELGFGVIGFRPFSNTYNWTCSCIPFLTFCRILPFDWGYGQKLRESRMFKCSKVFYGFAKLTPYSPSNRTSNSRWLRQRTLQLLLGSYIWDYRMSFPFRANSRWCAFHVYSPFRLPLVTYDDFWRPF